MGGAEAGLNPAPDSIRLTKTAGLITISRTNHGGICYKNHGDRLWAGSLHYLFLEVQDRMSPLTGQKSLFTALIRLDETNRLRPFLNRVVFLVGLLVWLSVQGVLIDLPLWTRPLPPEIDDSLTYVLKTKQMQDCFRQECLALEDLRSQLQIPSSDPEAGHQRDLAASRIFPVYHPLFSVLLLGVSKLGFSIMDSYKLVWTLAPLFFGLVMAWYLAVIWGRGAAGLALLLLAFKVFPDTGLHYVVPSNLTMALAVLLWTRLAARRGRAPVALVGGSVVLMAMHPIGRLYAVMAVAMSLVLAGKSRRPAEWSAAVLTLLLVVGAFVLPHLVDRPQLVSPAFLPPGGHFLWGTLQGAAASLVAVVADVVRLGPGLFGSAPLFCAAVVLGFLVTAREERRSAFIVTLTQAFFFIALFFHVSNHPADVIFRMWIPLVIILFGAVGQAMSYALAASWQWLLDRRSRGPDLPRNKVAGAWPILVLAVLFGYSVSMSTSGVEQVAATVRYIQYRQPLDFRSKQVEVLLSRATPGSRVLYTSMMIMPFYFINGAMSLGAVYYQPALADTPTEKKWLNRSDLRFAAVYNPTVYHPSFAGRDENNWWITSPDFHSSPLSKARKYQPLSRNGYLPAEEYEWVDVEIRAGAPVPRIRLLVKNTGPAVPLTVLPLGQSGNPEDATAATTTVPNHYSGWIDLPCPGTRETTKFRIVMPARGSGLAVGGVSFDNGPLHWPWSQKAELTFMPMNTAQRPLSVSFDPARLLPEPLTKKDITVLDDSGSTVLLELGPTTK